MLSCFVIIERNLCGELIITDWTVVDKTGGEMFTLDVVPGTSDDLVGVQITNVTMEFPIIRVSSNKLIQLAWFSDQVSYKKPNLYCVELKTE